MAIQTQCPGCSQQLSVPDEYAGMQGKCPSCGAMVTFGAAAAPAAAAAAAPAPPPPTAPAAWSPPPAAGAYAPPYPPPGADVLPGYPPPGPPRDNTELFNILGISVASFFLFLLFISCFLRWTTGVSGTAFGDGRLLLLLSLLLAVLVGLSFLNRKLLPLSMVIAGSFATFAFVVLLAHLGAGDKTGVILGVVAALFAMGGTIWTAVRLPLHLDLPSAAAAQPSFVRVYGALLGSQTLAVVLALVYWILYAVTAPAMRGPG